MRTDPGRDRVAGSDFPETRWSLVLAAGGVNKVRAEEALRELCVQYRQPIVAWLSRAATAVGDPEDLAHDFLVQLLERDRLGPFERREGQFRVWLRQCLRHFVRDYLDRQRAAKRGGGVVHVGLEGIEVEAAVERADESLDRGLAEALNREALKQLGDDWEACGRGALFRQLERYLLERPEPGAYAKDAEVLKVPVGRIKRAVLELREAHCDAFRQGVVHIAESGDVSAELVYLMTLLGRREESAAS